MGKVTQDPAKVSVPGGQLRLFIAADPPPAWRAEVAALAATAPPALAAWRWLPAAQYHLTLRFLGAVPAAALADLRPALTALAAATPALSLGASHWGVFPSARGARVLWLGIAGDLARLARPLACLFPQWGDPARPFQPHLTLARSRRAPLPVDPATLAALPLPVTPWPCRAITLYQSVLAPHGSTYTPLHTTPLAGEDFAL